MFWAFIIGVFSVILSAYTDRPYKFGLTCLAIYLTFGMRVYCYTYSGFTTISIENKEIKLIHEGWNRKVIKILVNQMKNVTFKIQAKKCYIKLEDLNRQVYRSVNVQDLGDGCQKLKQIIANSLQ